MKKKSDWIYIAIIVVPLCIFYLVSGARSYYAKAHWDTATATIQESVTEYSRSRGKTYRHTRFYVDYVYDGVEYEHVEIDNISVDGVPQAEGDIITIYVNPDNPENISCGDGSIDMMAVLSLLLIVLIIYGIDFLIKRRKKGNKHEK